MGGCLGKQHESPDPVENKFVKSREQHRHTVPSEESSEEFREFIKNRGIDCSLMIIVDYGLLDWLINQKVLSPDKIQMIRKELGNDAKINKLLHEFLEIPNSDFSIETVLSALDQTHNKHASNFLRTSGLRFPHFGDDWPIWCCPEKSILDKSKREIIELVDWNGGLSEELLAVGCVNRKMDARFKSINSNAKKNVLLLWILERGSLKMFKMFISCLINTNQQLVASLLSSSVDEHVRPLSSRQLLRLSTNRAVLVHIIDPESGLLSKLLAAGCVNKLQKEHIESAPTQSEAGKRFLNVVERSSEQNFDKFIRCLNGSNQQHVSDILLQDGVVAQLIVNISNTANVEPDEARIVTELKDLLRFTPAENRQRTIEEVQQHINELRSHDARLFTVTTGSGIGLFYFCTSLAGLHYLHDLYCGSQLKVDWRDLFVLLLNTGRAWNLGVDSVLWKQSNYNNCAQHLYESAGLFEISTVYKLALQRQDVDIEHNISSLRIDQLPFELIEMLLVKTAGQLFAAINQVTPRAEVYTLITLSMVSSLWRLTFNNRMFIKRQLQRQFKRVCRPFKCSPQRKESIFIESDLAVMGLAVFNSSLYVACDGSNTIKVFTDKPPFSRLEDFQVAGLVGPSDIVVCDVTSQLYVADYKQSAIWRVNLLRVKQIDKFITTQCPPRCLSSSERRLLIVPHDGDLLFLYDDGGSELKRIELPKYMNATHAVETSRKTFIVSHGNRFLDDTQQQHNSVSELNANGQVVRTFENRLRHNGSIQLDRPFYLISHGVDDVIVADNLNCRLVGLSSQLSIRRILLSLRGQPTRVCLSKTSRLCFVSYDTDDELNMITVLSIK